MTNLHEYMNITDKRKILYVITKGHWGGANRYVFELALEMKKQGHDVAVACGGSGIFTQKLQGAGIPIFEIQSFQRNINLIKEFESLFELKHIIRTFNPDVVHLNSSKAGGSGALIARILGVKRIIFTAHGWPFFEPRNLLWKSAAWFFSWLTTLLAHSVILVSHHDYKRTRMPFVHKKLSVIHTAVSDITFLARDVARTQLATLGAQGVHENALWICTIGEYVKNKNLLTAIQAVAAVNQTSEQKLFYTIIGVDGDERPKLEAYIHEHHLENTIQLLGFIDNARTYLPAYDMFLLPSYKEGLPYGILEAGAARLATIASNVGGIPEIIEDNTNGLLIDPRKIDTLKSALRTYVKSPETRMHFGEALHKKVTRDFSLAEMFQKTTALYKL